MNKLTEVVRGLLELPDGLAIACDSPEWFEWVESVECRSFRFSDGCAPYTCRKETVKGVDYWYGYRKVDGKLRKRYMGKSADLTAQRLTRVGELLEVPNPPKLPKIIGNSTERIQELHVAELGNLEAANTELHNKVTQLKTQLAQLRAQLAECWSERLEMAAIKQELAAKYEELLKTERSLELEKLRWQTQLSDARGDLEEANGKLLQRNDTIRKLEREVTQLRSQLSSQTAPPVGGFDFPEPATLLNQLKGRRKKSRADLADVEILLDLFCNWQ